jgi:hypothetical protein
MNPPQTYIWAFVNDTRPHIRSRYTQCKITVHESYIYIYAYRCFFTLGKPHLAFNPFVPKVIIPLTTQRFLTISSETGKCHSILAPWHSAILQYYCISAEGIPVLFLGGWDRRRYRTSCSSAHSGQHAFPNA